MSFEVEQHFSWLDKLASRRLAALLGVAVFGLCLYISRDYWRISQIYMAPSERAPAYQGDTLQKIQGSWVFRNQVRFAELGITPLTPEGAEHTLALAKDLLHFSAEPQVAQKIIESAEMLGRGAEAQYYRERFKAAFPQVYAQWSTNEPPKEKP